MGPPPPCQWHPYQATAGRVSGNSLIIHLNIIGVVVVTTRSRPIIVDIHPPCHITGEFIPYSPDSTGILIGRIFRGAGEVALTPSIGTGRERYVWIGRCTRRRGIARNLIGLGVVIIKYKVRRHRLNPNTHFYLNVGLFPTGIALHHYIIALRHIVAWVPIETDCLILTAAPRRLRAYY
jgi:hypothetical protein